MTAAQRGRPREYPPDVAEARKLERGRRNLAVRIALSILRDRHRQEYQALYETAVSRVDRERGPLPGDGATP